MQVLLISRPAFASNDHIPLLTCGADLSFLGPSLLLLLGLLVRLLLPVRLFDSLRGERMSNPSGQFLFFLLFLLLLNFFEYLGFCILRTLDQFFRFLLQNVDHGLLLHQVLLDLSGFDPPAVIVVGVLLGGWCFSLAVFSLSQQLFLLVHRNHLAERVFVLDFLILALEVVADRLPVALHALFLLFQTLLVLDPGFLLLQDLVVALLLLVGHRLDLALMLFDNFVVAVDSALTLLNALL